MIALSLLFLLLILLLCWLWSIIKQHFLYLEHINSLQQDTIQQTQKYLFAKNAATSTQLVKEKTNIVIADGLVYLNQELNSLPEGLEARQDDFEILFFRYQSLLKLYLDSINRADNA